MKLSALKNMTTFLALCLFCCGYAHSSAEYEDTKSEAIKVRSELMSRYQGDSTLLKKQSFLTEANLTFQKLLIEQLAPAWYGTEWAFHGTSQKPGQGTIACGYFVTTLLRDAGIKLERARLAQQASESIIKSLVSKESIRRFSNKPLSTFLSNLTDWGSGVYIVGLDFHVGFISVETEGVYFIHSSYQSPYAVTREIASQSVILASSKYRVVGKLEDEKFITGWLNQTQFETIGK